MPRLVRLSATSDERPRMKECLELLQILDLMQTSEKRPEVLQGNMRMISCFDQTRQRPLVSTTSTSASVFSNNISSRLVEKPVASELSSLYRSTGNDCSSSSDQTANVPWLQRKGVLFLKEIEDVLLSDEEIMKAGPSWNRIASSYRRNYNLEIDCCSFLERHLTMTSLDNNKSCKDML